MTKSIHRDEYQVFLALLKQRRTDAGLTQVQCSEELGRSQSFVSDVERGLRRLDLLQLRDHCAVLGITLTDFVTEFERLAPRRAARLPKRPRASNS